MELFSKMAATRAMRFLWCTQFSHFCLQNSQFFQQKRMSLLSIQFRAHWLLLNWLLLTVCIATQAAFVIISEDQYFAFTYCVLLFIVLDLSNSVYESLIDFCFGSWILMLWYFNCATFICWVGFFSVLLFVCCACLDICYSHFLTIIAGVDLHFRHDSKLPVCQDLGIEPRSPCSARQGS